MSGARLVQSTGVVAMDLVMHSLQKFSSPPLRALSFLFRRTPLDVSLHGLEKSRSDLPKGFKVVIATSFSRALHGRVEDEQSIST